MSEQELIEKDIQAYLVQHQEKELLRFVSVGSVDDGKSTLIGRLLHDTHGIYEDQLSAVKRASVKNNQEIDFSLFTDGLKAEREQGITIDVAYRYFSTAKRKFIIADTPGHVQYTRNMATGASTANVAIILIDARLGVLQQSRRHAYIAALLGIPHLVVCINKMDLKAYSEEVYVTIRQAFTSFADKLGFKDLTFIPISALKGDNVAHPSTEMSWHTGGTLLDYLETVPISNDLNYDDFRYPVQYVQRPNLDYRGFAGTIASGVVKKGDPILVLPARTATRVKGIDTFEGEVESAHAPMSVTLRLEDEVDVSRGAMLVHPDNAPRMAARFDAMLVWMSEKSLDPKKGYLLKHTTQIVRAEVDQVHSVTDLETLTETAAERLELNDIGRVTLSCHKALFFDAYRENRATGAFVLIDSLTNNTVAAGMILSGDAALKRSVRPSDWLGPTHTMVGSAERSERLAQKGCTVWLTGLPACGKTAIAYALERRLFDVGRFALVVDPDDGLSHGVPQDGSSPDQVLELARRCTDAGLITIFAYASPTLAERESVRTSIGRERFVEVHVNTSLDKCRSRDRRGSYAAPKAEPVYQAPAKPDASVSLDQLDPEEAAFELVRVLERRGLLPSSYAL